MLVLKKILRNVAEPMPVLVSERSLCCLLCFHFTATIRMYYTVQKYCWAVLHTSCVDHQASLFCETVGLSPSASLFCRPLGSNCEQGTKITLEKNAQKVRVSCGRVLFWQSIFLFLPQKSRTSICHTQDHRLHNSGNERGSHSALVPSGFPKYPSSLHLQ